MKNYILIFLLLAATTLSAAVTWDGTSTAWTNGSGTEADPYLIETPQHLAYLAAQVNAGNTYAGVYFKQTEDFDLDGKTWMMIGTWTYGGSSNKPFSGVYDGGNKKISGCSSISIFAFVKDVKIANLTLDCKANFATSASGECEMNNVIHTNTNCTSLSSYTGTDHETQKNYWGGILHYATDGSQITFVRCSNSANLSSAVNNYVGYSSSNDYYYYAGGLLGYSDGSVAIKNCGNIGNIIVQPIFDGYANGYPSFYGYVGGLIGRASSTSIEKSYNKATLSVLPKRTTSSGTPGYFFVTHAVGLVASGNVTISESYVRGNIASYGGYYSRDDDPHAFACAYAQSGTVHSCYFQGVLLSGKSRSASCELATSTQWNLHFSENANHNLSIAGSEGKSLEFMKTSAMVTILNNESEAFCMDYSGINDGYPILKWQLEDMTLYNLRATCAANQGTVTGGGKYPENSNVQIKATPKDGYVFTGWSDGNTDNPRSVTVTADATYVAQFSQSAYTIYVNQDCTTSVE